MQNKHKKKVGVFGIGNVGTQVVLQLQSSTNYDIQGIFSRKEKNLGVKQYKSWKDLVDASDIVIETIGGVEIAKEIVFYALSNGKKVLTANKYLIATQGHNLLPKYQDLLRFESAVCGAIPIIKLLKTYYAKDSIDKILGIFNGTTNFILTQISKGLDFDSALKKAQELGFAEADPTFDIEGIDAAHKAIILHYLAFNKWIDIDDIKIQKPKFAKKGEKNIGIITKNSIEFKNLILQDFCNVNENLNAVSIESLICGNSFISGQGAGGKQTAFALLSEID